MRSSEIKISLDILTSADQVLWHVTKGICNRGQGYISKMVANVGKSIYFLLLFCKIGQLRYVQALDLDIQ